MKTPLLFALSVATSLALPVLAFSAPAQPEGTFASRTATWYFAESAESCRKNGGNPMGEEDDNQDKKEQPKEEEPSPVECVIPVDDVATVEKKDGALNLSITTWGSNTHSCNYEGKATLTGDKLISEEKIDDAEDGKPGFCRVIVQYLDENTVTVDTEGNACRYFCGARAFGLGIEKAVRTDPKDIK